MIAMNKYAEVYRDVAPVGNILDGEEHELSEVMKAKAIGRS